MITILLFLLAFNLVIAIHEAGHYLAARRYGIPVAVFSFGFGPRLWGFIRGGTDFRLSLFPFGGYIRMGTLDDADAIDPTDDPDNLPLGPRVLISAAGPLVNLVAGLLVHHAHLVISRGWNVEALVNPYRALALLPALLWDAVFAGWGARMGSPIGFFRDGPGVLDEAGFAAFWVALNYAVFAFNMLPLGFLDGGRIVRDLLNTLRPRWGNRFMLATTLLFLFLLGRGFWNDLFG